jgi:hypothetical protein
MRLTGAAQPRPGLCSPSAGERAAAEEEEEEPVVESVAPCGERGSNLIRPRASAPAPPPPAPARGGRGAQTAYSARATRAALAASIPRWVGGAPTPRPRGESWTRATVHKNLADASGGIEGERERERERERGDQPG